MCKVAALRLRNEHETFEQFSFTAGTSSPVSWLWVPQGAHWFPSLTADPPPPPPPRGPALLYRRLRHAADPRTNPESPAY